LAALLSGALPCGRGLAPAVLLRADVVVGRRFLDSKPLAGLAVETSGVLHQDLHLWDVFFGTGLQLFTDPLTAAGDLQVGFLGSHLQ